MHGYSLQNKMEMMRDELAHKRQLELAQVTKVPTAPQPIPGKHNVCMHNMYFCNCCVIVLLKCVQDHLSDEVLKATQTLQAHGNACAPTTKYHDTGNTLVFDNGSYLIKAGVAGHNEPDVLFRSYARSEPVMVNPFVYTRHKVWGIYRGEITDWDVIEV